MSMLAKPKTSARKVSAKSGRVKAMPVPVATRIPPPAKRTLGEIAKMKDFGKGLNGALVEEMVADRHL